MRKKDLAVLAGLTAFAIIMRFFSFFPSVISHDESTYLEIAREMLHGKIYFVDLVDTKPIGIFAVLGFYIKYISHSIFVIRLLTAIVVALTSFVIYKISMFAQEERKPAIASAVIFIFYLSVYSFFGIVVNPELYYLLFTALGFYLFIRYKNFIGFFLCGFLLGIGFILKYVVLFDLAAFLLYFSLVAILRKDMKTFLKSVYLGVIALIGFSLPFAGVTLYYYSVGHLKEFFYYTFEVTSRYPVERTLMQVLIFVFDFLLRFLPITFFFFYVLIKQKGQNEEAPVTKGLIILWCLMVLLAVLIPGKSFGHYFIQMMLPISIYAGYFFRSDFSKPAWLNKIITYPVGTIILVALVMANIFMQKHDYFDKPDIPKEVANFLKPRIQKGDRIFTGNYQQVIYYLVGTDSPVKYVHRTLMCSEQHRKLLQINLKEEMDNLMAKNLKYIIMNGPYCYAPMNDYIAKNYNLIHVFDKSVCLYERKH